MESANDVKEVMNVQRELSSVTQQLEAKKNVMERLSKQAGLSTISLRLQQKDPKYEPPPFKPKVWSVARTFKRAVHHLIRLAQKAVDVAVFVAVFAAAGALLAAVLALCLPSGIKLKLRELARGTGAPSKADDAGCPGFGTPADPHNQ